VTVRRFALALVGLLGCGDDWKISPDAAIEVQDAPTTCEVTEGEPALALERVADDLGHPIGLVSPPGDARLFVIEQQAARVRIIDPGDLLRDEPFLDIHDDTARGYEQGLLTIAFHPHYADNGRFFLSYARGGDDALVVEEWHVDPGDPYRADPSTRRILLEVPHSTNYHYGSALVFGPDGYLYVSSGDGGPQRDPEQRGQALDTLRGKLLRIDVDHDDGDLPYTIPDDNPFAGDPTKRGEIWAYGLRNPWRVTFDAETATFFIGDVGFDSVEELDALPAATPGVDFGWSVLEGSECQGARCDTRGFTPPIYEYRHTDGCAVIGGPVYRGCAMPGHHGRLFFADFCNGWVRSLRYTDGAVSDVTLHESLQLPTVANFGTDALGELYVMDFDSCTIDRIVPVR
jgi:glucose/arabinose dehydrogenase